jgi:hypothetical protein
MLLFANEASTDRRFGGERSFHGGDLRGFVMREYGWSFWYCVVCVLREIVEGLKWS